MWLQKTSLETPTASLARTVVSIGVLPTSSGWPPLAKPTTAVYLPVGRFRVLSTNHEPLAATGLAASSNDVPFAPFASRTSPKNVSTASAARLADFPTVSPTRPQSSPPAPPNPPYLPSPPPSRPPLPPS